MGDLDRASLEGANLGDTKVADSQLRKAKSLEGATQPSVNHAPAPWEKRVPCPFSVIAFPFYLVPGPRKTIHDRLTRR
jgi:hypothetical protein